MSKAPTGPSWPAPCAGTRRWPAEATDTAAISGLAGVHGLLAAAEFADTAVFYGGPVVAKGSLSVIEAADSAGFAGLAGAMAGPGLRF